MRHRAAAFGGAEVRAGGENGPIFRRKSPSNGRPECSCDASLAAKHETQAAASLIGKLYLKCRCYQNLSTLRLLPAKAPVGSLDIDTTGLLQICGAHHAAEESEGACAVACHRLCQWPALEPGLASERGLKRGLGLEALAPGRTSSHRRRRRRRPSRPSRRRPRTHSAPDR
jgi:hypothetical protein